MKRVIAAVMVVSILTGIGFGAGFGVNALIDGNDATPTVLRASTCPSPVPCPIHTPCPACPEIITDACASIALMIDRQEVLLDVADKEGVIDATPKELRTDLDLWSERFDENCQNVSLAEASPLTSVCAMVGETLGRQDIKNLYEPSSQGAMWSDKYDYLLDKYCNIW